MRQFRFFVDSCKIEWHFFRKQSYYYFDHVKRRIDWNINIVYFTRDSVSKMHEEKNEFYTTFSICARNVYGFICQTNAKARVGATKKLLFHFFPVTFLVSMVTRVKTIATLYQRMQISSCYWYTKWLPTMVQLLLLAANKIINLQTRTCLFSNISFDVALIYFISYDSLNLFLDLHKKYC